MNHAQTPARLGGAQQGRVANRQNRVDRMPADPLDDAPGRFLGPLKPQRHGIVFPGIVQNVAAVAAQQHFHPEFPSRLHKLPRLVAGRRIEKH